MQKDIVERWEPSSHLKERPAEIFDLSWQGDQQRLLLNLYYASNAGEDDEANALIIFHDVVAHRVFDEDMDDSAALSQPAAQLADPYPYGGRWPFLEVKSSTWVSQLVETHCGCIAADFRHLIVTTRNMHLHVACSDHMQPDYLPSR